MDQIKKSFYIKNVLSQDEINILWQYMQVEHASNNCNFDDSQTSFGETALYGSTVTDGLLLLKKDIFEKTLNKKLLPTYSFWRMYTKFANLKKHKDRPSCEISVTVNIGSDGTKWPIFMEGTSIDLDEGDAVIYLGRELTHWREEFQGDWCAQTFLHYVDKEGNNKNEFRDRRYYWGVQR